MHEPVSTVLEMTEIPDAPSGAKGGPAVIFEKPVRADGSPSDIPVLANLFGTVKRVAMGVTMGGVERRDALSLREVGELMAQLRQPEPPRSLGEAMELLPLAKTAMSMKPKTGGVFAGTPACQQIVLKGNDIDLSRLPVQTCWPGEPAPAHHLAADRHQRSGAMRARTTLQSRHLSPAGDRQKTRTLMRWLKHRGGAQHHARWAKEKTTPLPAAAVLGADPGTILAAVTPVPDTLSEYQFAGLLRGQRVELAQCVTQPLMVPAEAEIVLDGEVSLTDYRDEGPYGDHTGYYNSVEQFPVFTVTAITMRRDPIYLSTFTGRPPDEPSILGEALNEIFIPLLVQQFPEIVDFWLPPEGCSYRIAVVSIRKAYPGHAKRIMMAVWSYLRQFMYTKWVIVVDDDIDARNWKDVMWAVSTRMDPARDITLVRSTPIDYLDFASPGRDWARRSAWTPPTNGRPRPSANGAAKSAWTTMSCAPSPKNGHASGCRARASRSGSEFPWV